MRKWLLGAILVAVGLAVFADPHGGIPFSVGEGLERVERVVKGGDAWTGDLADHVDSWTVAHTNADGTPVRWDPCTEITYAVNTAAGGPGAIDDVHEAVNQVAAATGLRFRFVGETAHIPTAADAAAGPAATGATIVIAWAAPDQSDLYDLAGGDGHTNGVGGPDIVDVGGVKTFTSGSIVIDPAADANATPGFSASSRGTLLLHELGHVVGLSHTEDRTQIMDADLNSAPRFGSGDLTGLAAVGGHC